MNPSTTPARGPRPTVGIIIRFRNSAATLPAVLAGLARQTWRPDRILGVDTGSTDASPALLREAGAQLLSWNQPYHHARVLNFALGHCPTDLVVVLSSHTVLESPTALAELVAALDDPRVACASGCWDEDPFYSDTLDRRELASKGLKFCSIYSNSMGILRRSLWEQVPFDESLPTMEDAGWALEQVARGHLCRRLPLNFSYRRGGGSRDYIFAVTTFQLAARHRLPVAWLGARATLGQLMALGARQIRRDGASGREPARILWDRLRAWAIWRWVRPVTE